MSEKLWKSVPVRPSEITPKDIYLRRREFLKVGAIAAAAAVVAACGASQGPTPTATLPPRQTPQPGRDEYGDPVTPYEAITNYNNYYEFSADKEAVARLAKNFQTRPWTVEVSGLVAKPRRFDIDDLLKKYPQEERIYRLRCVEGWSMVIPWLGFPLAKLLKEVEPLGSARYVSFVSVSRPEEMPGMRSGFYPWPYREGLRLDEALHPLTILATGLYGELLPNQNGAPLRLVVPWKYGFKSAKAIVKIELTEQQPPTFWNLIAPHEYGFYSNVNPNKPHPRWSQATERRIGESGRRPTLMFNGYAEEVAHLYEGMDLMQEY
ncbi:MAG: protein-methionine-sulfoxide reductase catalytic subunit MsrP [Anaerolineales bacterium]|nr:protein-methionine-sulfoxide reductase catalytic subunit MsrP [Anaerolineales bacterium]MCS7247919.1 protein-methionine-sulfoxide reductase catalytic subunit MsrP [Anaerolineales bacterium]MDW8161729.1 protein-methionine-sulfoxide reductase catalytic subunit MsrP [Anaerolineales bacterium]MDW8445767.1 protein-methionine-sulfoxide reductase catalytic subunit MsrP [Anaerolineales bacterium]